MKTRKQVYELTLEDLSKFPVWEFALDEEGEAGQDEATVRPYELSGALDSSDGMFIVRASFTLADSSEMQGYLTPPVQGDESLGTLQPIIVTVHGQVGFWHGIMSPSPEQLAQNYRSLGRDARSVFPLRFESQVEVVGGPIRGSLAGFMVLDDIATRKIKTLT